ncbi:MAG: type I DNA topoisomerase [Patescibacteria group bacterium]|nr:type I DNA topoisomerase [Patescibacteria group bacterium]MCL5262103.1 type I DNA topoisomerase [Patescibacteria group bacterium]
MNLVIVESPTKAKTIGKFLGSKYKVESSFGHIRDLPKSKLGIDIEHDFEPQYVIPTKNRKHVNELKKLVSKTDNVILATDEDREGEAIAWHLATALNLDPQKTERIVFHEITEDAIAEALKHPRVIDMNLVASQQARRVLDRLVGYKLSPFLWKKVMSHLSAGRVQSVAVRLIVEREQEIRGFKSEAYYTIEALFDGEPDFRASLAKIDGKPVPTPGVESKSEAEEIVSDLKDSTFQVVKIEEKTVKRSPLPPFTTSTLQQESSKRMHLSAKQTMMLAQSLYENGYITYMRTDSVNLSKDSVAAAAEWLASNLGAEYATDCPRFFKTKSKMAQEAHEAVRPTNPLLSPDKIKVEGREQKLYELIWRRFIASQMPAAIFNQGRIDIEAESEGNPDYLLVSSGNVLKFDGFLKIWPSQFTEKELPAVKKNKKLTLQKAEASEHFTEPPARYNEASLIKTLEEAGIGRPSTYAPIISVIQERNYVTKNQDRRFEPTEIGELVNAVLTEHFPQIVDIEFTAKMEDELDDVAEGKTKWQQVVKNFYEPFSKTLEEKYESVEKQKPAETTEEICEKCGKPMVVKYGRFGKFLACSGYPECKTTKKIPGSDTVKTKEGLDIKCPECKEGMVVRRRTKKGRFFYGCSRYPECKFASWTKPKAE